MFRKTTVGSEIDSYCGKCKLVLNHVVTAMVENEPRRVRCLTCQSEHNHRLPSVKKPKAARSGKSRASSSKASVTSRWQTALASWDGSTTKDYSIYETFNVDEWISHVKFGNGLVIDTPSSDRMITLFESGEKMLMQGKPRK